jgi:thiamine kinase-like enzyme
MEEGTHMNDLLQQVHQSLTAISGFEGLAPNAYSSQRLGGLTNLVFKIDTGKDRYVLRIPGEGTEEYIDRAVEIHNAKVAARATVSAEVIYADSDTGIMLTRFIDDIVTMTPEEFAKRDGAAARAGKALNKMHSCGEDFEFRFELFSMIDDYLGILEKQKAELPDGYFEMVKAAQPVREALDQNPAILAPCHCDPLCENFLDNGERMWIVDWEYSGMNDPFWDLGDLSVEAGFTPVQDLEMIQAYSGASPSASEIGRMVVYKAMCDLLWTLWGLIQHSNANPAEDFWAYSIDRFERCKTLMADPSFEQHVKAISEYAEVDG